MKKQFLEVVHNEPTENVVSNAFKHVEEECGLGEDKKITWKGNESKESKMLIGTLVANFSQAGIYVQDQTPLGRYMATQFLKFCEEADTDKSGTFSQKEVIPIWDNLVKAVIESNDTQLKRIDEAIKNA